MGHCQALLTPLHIGLGSWLEGMARYQHFRKSGVEIFQSTSRLASSFEL